MNFKKSRFFIETDFDAFDTALAESEEDYVISARQYVVENRFKVLHFDDNSGNGLMDFFETYKLYSHWQLQHLTNVYWPYPVANGGWVDYLRMGYGKEKSLVQDLAKRSGIFKEVTNFGERDAIAFYCVTQLQVGLNNEVWWVNLYIDKKGWLEQYNLLDKIKDPIKEKEFGKLLNRITKEGYQFYIYPFPYEKPINLFKGQDFIDTMRDFRMNKRACSISIVKLHDIDDPNNTINNILDYLKGEFTNLLPLYNFISWQPKTNDYLKGL